MSQTHYCVMGDVTVAADAMIAPGVVLQASPGSRIVIASGACLAGGVCIQSRQGVLTIGVSANLGANVLVVGNGKVGDYACVSAGSTLMNPQLISESLVPPGALVVSESGQGFAQEGSSSAENQVTVSQQNDSFVNTFVEPLPIGPKPIETTSLNDQNGQYVDPSVQSNGVQLDNGSSNGGSNRQGDGSSAIAVAGSQHVYGKDQINQLLSTLFPNRMS